MSSGITCGGVAVSIAFLFFRASVASVEEYMPLYLRQVGLTATYIGVIPLFGLLTQAVGVPLISYVADKLRARKSFLFLSILFIIPITLLFPLPQYPQQPCEGSIKNVSLRLGNHTTISPHESLNRFRLPSTNANVSALNRHKYNQISSPYGDDQGIDGIATKFSENQSSGILNDGTKLHERLKFFGLMIFLRGLFELFKRLIVTMLTVAVLTHTKQDKTKYGYYASWGEIGGGLALFVIGITVSRFRHFICTYTASDYYLAFVYAAAFQCLTMVPLHWLNFEYFEQRVVNLTEVKAVLLKPHYLLLLAIACHGGLCSAFQTRWEFWYMEELGGTPVVMAVGGLVRRPVVAVWFFLSRSVVDRLGELNGIAISLFVFAASFAALAFATNPWHVIVFDNFQSAAFVLMFASIVIHFSKAASKASSATIQGKLLNS
jgi:MFS family permease